MSEIEFKEDELFELPKEQADEYIDLNEEVEFTDEEEVQFLDLLQLGKLEETIEFLGHTFVISTLTMEEEIELGRTLERYQTMPTHTQAFMACVVAAGLRSVDGEPLHYPLGKISVAEDIRRKFNVIKKYYPTTIAYIYDQTKLLDAKLAPLWAKLGKESS
jgi:hypothetical protein